MAVARAVLSLYQVWTVSRLTDKATQRRQTRIGEGSYNQLSAIRRIDRSIERPQDVGYAPECEDLATTSPIHLAEYSTQEHIAGWQGSHPNNGPTCSKVGALSGSVLSTAVPSPHSKPPSRLRRPGRRAGLPANPPRTGLPWEPSPSS
jgi:hypothetical protein